MSSSRIIIALAGALLATVPALVPSTAQADDELYKCTAQATFEVCVEGTCSGHPVSHNQYGASQQLASSRAVTGCDTQLTSRMAASNPSASTRIVQSCRVTECEVHAQSGGQQWEAEIDGSAAPEQGSALSVGTKRVREIAACKSAVALICELCGSGHDACKRVGDAPASEARCSAIEAAMREIKAAKLGTDAVAVMCEGIADDIRASRF